MFRIRYIAFLLTFYVYIGIVNGQNINRCGTMEVLERLKRENPGLEQRMQEIEDQIQQWVRSKSDTSMGLKKSMLLSQGIKIMPVVVHVVYNTSAQNISDAQIISQINVLNEDYRKMPGTPGYNIHPVGADARIEFRLAEDDPNNNPTNGIIRTQTSVISFTDDDAVKYTSQGGHDAWDTGSYLNIWVCNIPGLLGYAQFPGGPAATDGVVINYEAFGDNVGTATVPYHLGRTTSHEIGHYLNLYHTFQGGCSNSNCSTQGDRVCDSPPPPRFGYAFSVSLGLDSAGTWIELPNGDRVWRLRIAAPGAHSINLLYDEFWLPDGGRLFIYNEDRSTVLGAFTSANNKGHGKFSTGLVRGDTSILEYY